MFLSKTGTSINTTKTIIEFEQIANDLIMVSVDNDINDQTKVFSYWRLKGSGENPPLEVGVNTTMGTIKRIVFFVDEDCIDQFQLENMHTSKGNALVDCGIFTRQNDYVNSEGNYFVSLIGEKLLCRFCKEFKVKEVVTNGDIEIYVDNHVQIIGFALNNLTECAIKAIKSLL